MKPGDMMVGARLQSRDKRKEGQPLYAIVEKVDGDSVKLKYEGTNRTGIASMAHITERYELAKEAVPAYAPLLTDAGACVPPTPSLPFDWKLAPMVSLATEERRDIHDIAQNLKRIADYLWSKRPGRK